MSYNRAEVVLCLKLIAAKAEQLANDVANGKLWEGELSSGLGAIREQLERASREARDDRR
jgi:hypothetical protein